MGLSDGEQFYNGRPNLCQSETEVTLEKFHVATAIAYPYSHDEYQTIPLAKLQTTLTPFSPNQVFCFKLGYLEVCFSSSSLR